MKSPSAFSSIRFALQAVLRLVSTFSSMTSTWTYGTWQVTTNMPYRMLVLVLGLHASRSCSAQALPQLSWSNAAYTWDRIRYPEEHEVEGSGRDHPREVLSPLVLLSDSAGSFSSPINIPLDFEQCTEGGNHLKCETYRISILRRGLEAAVTHLGACENVAETVNEAFSQAQLLESLLKTPPQYALRKSV